jgi:hypothetical protein
MFQNLKKHALLQSAHIGFGAHLAPYTIAAVGPFPRSKTV